MRLFYYKIEGDPTKSSKSLMWPQEEDSPKQDYFSLFAQQSPHRIYVVDIEINNFVSLQPHYVDNAAIYVNKP